MICYSELMIGDYVLVNGTPRKVEMITKNKIGYHINPQENRLYYARLSDVEPIEITEEILRNLGFTETEKKADENTAVFDGWYLISGILPLNEKTTYVYISVHLWELGVLIKVDAYFDGYVRKAHLPKAPYLHQLQQACRICGIEKDWKL